MKFCGEQNLADTMMEDDVQVEDHDEYGDPVQAEDSTTTTGTTMEDEAGFAIAVQAEDATTTTDSGYVTGKSLSDTDSQPPQRCDIGIRLPQVPQQLQHHQAPHRLTPNRDDSGRPNHGICNGASSYRETLKQLELSN